jgi:hypothetical protein
MRLVLWSTCVLMMAAPAWAQDDASADDDAATHEDASVASDAPAEPAAPVVLTTPLADVDASPSSPTRVEPMDEPAPEPAREPEFGIRGTAELGFLGVLDHRIRLGSDGTEIDYIADGAQSNLFFFARVSLEVDIWRQHHITFLYQPLELVSEAVLPRDLLIDGQLFPSGTPVQFFYGFPFFRVSWDFDVLDAPNELLAFGLGLQLRNADISFRSLNGELYRARNDVGPVPLLRARGRFPIDRFFVGFEVDGFYAPISVLNGSDTEVTGAIFDGSLRFGWRFVDHGDVFVNLRYLAGGAVGAGDPTPTSDGQQSNWLHFLTLSLGATLDSRP